MSLYGEEELNDSPSEELSLSGVSCTRRFLVPWANRILFAKAILIQAGPFGLGPASYPHGLTATLADRVTVQPFGDRAPDAPNLDLINNTNYYDKALVTVTYKTSDRPSTNDPNQQQENLPEGTWATYEQNFSGEFLTIPSRGLLWGSDLEGSSPVRTQVSEDAKATILIPLIDHVVTWNEVPYPPWKAIREASGNVNNATFRVPVNGLQVSKECLLFEGCQSKTEFKFGLKNLSMTQTWSLTYTFKQRELLALGGDVLTVDGDAGPVGWNHAYRDEIGKWDVPKTTNEDGEDRIYSSYDFKKLFQFEGG